MGSIRGNPNQMCIPEALTGGMAAHDAGIEFAGHHIVPVFQHLIHTFKPEDGHEAFTGPGILGKIFRLFF